MSDVALRTCAVCLRQQKKDLEMLSHGPTQCIIPVCRAEAAKKAMRVLGMISRQFRDLDKECFTILYKSFVRPHMEFAKLRYKPAGHPTSDVTLNVWRKCS